MGLDCIASTVLGMGVRCFSLRRIRECGLPYLRGACVKLWVSGKLSSVKWNRWSTAS